MNDLTNDEIAKVANILVMTEYKKAADKFPQFNSGHEGYAVILEELDELWDEIKKRDPDPKELLKEATQVAAMGMRFMIDVVLRHKKHAISTE